MVELWSRNLTAGIGARGTDSVLLRSFSALDLSLDGAALEDRLGAFPEQHRQVWAEAPAIDVSRYIAVQNVKAVLRAAHAALAMDSDLAAAAVQARSKLLETLGRMR